MRDTDHTLEAGIIFAQNQAQANTDLGGQKVNEITASSPQQSLNLKIDPKADRRAWRRRRSRRSDRGAF